MLIVMSSPQLQATRHPEYNECAGDVTCTFLHCDAVQCSRGRRR